MNVFQLAQANVRRSYSSRAWLELPISEKARLIYAEMRLIDAEYLKQAKLAGSLRPMEPSRVAASAWDLTADRSGLRT